MRRWVLIAGLVLAAVALISWRTRRVPVPAPAPVVSVGEAPRVAVASPDAAPVGEAPTSPAGPTSKKGAVEVAFLFHFVRGIVWPASALGAPGAKLELCVLGQTEVAPALEESVRGPSWREYPARVRRVKTGAGAAALAGCHLLFLPEDSGPSQDAILAAIRDRPILTVSDAKGASERGVHFAFVVRNSRLRFRVNVPALSRSGLRVASDALLRLGELVFVENAPTPAAAALKR